MVYAPSWAYQANNPILLQTPLHMAGSHANVATLLLEHGAEVNEQNRYGEVSLYLKAA